MRRKLTTAWLGIVAFTTGLGIHVGAQAFDDAKYPDWSGAWNRMGSGDFDPSKPRGLGQQAPLTPEYRIILEQSLADQDNGGQGVNPGYRCSPHGMPRIMIGILP